MHGNVCIYTYFKYSFRNLIKKISEVTLDELPSIGLKYVMPLFDPQFTRTAMVCPPSKLQDIAKEFNR